jgi:hypothetical protein
MVLWNISLCNSNTLCGLRALAGETTIMPDKNNTGFLFLNKNKLKDTHKDYEGSANIEGVQYWISAWVKQSDQSGKYLSIAFDQKKVLSPDEL